MTFKKINSNPMGRQSDDCVIRAIAHATGKTWREVFDALCAIGREEYDMPNAKRVCDRYLESIGWHKFPMPKKYTGARYKRYTVRDFADLAPDKTMIISVANHMTVLDHGQLVDTWDCSESSIGNYWMKLEEIKNNT